MAQPPRTTIAGTFFIIAITFSRRRRFQVDATARLFVETLQHYQAAGSYKLFAFVVMPDHIHLLLQTDDISQSMKNIKGGFTRCTESKFWQRGFTDHLILDRRDFDTHRDYIHQNPVRAHLALTSDTYPYSSAYRVPTLLPSIGKTASLTLP